MSAIKVLGKLTSFKTLNTVSWEVNYFSHNPAVLDMRHFSWDTAGDETYERIGLLKAEFSMIQDSGRLSVAIPASNVQIISWLQDHYSTDKRGTISLTAAYSTVVEGFLGITRGFAPGNADPEAYAFLNNYLFSIELKTAKIAGMIARASDARHEVFFAVNFEESDGEQPMLVESARAS